ncbi:MAG TPA: hypothetical protein VGO80_07440 [Solirubrobacteraceae bacterium]|jgi:hypothetical protein|nr:hypothetical protein [Solirubrobacteraceae bacterium]
MGTVTTIAACWIAASYVIAIALPADQLRRPHAEWEAAGRDRRFWVTLTLIFGFHGLGQYAAAAYLVGVRPRLRAVEQARAPRRARAGAGLAAHWQPADRERATERWQRTAASSAAEELALLAALLVLASSLIHAVVIAVHFEEYWLFGVCFAVATVLQAIWTAQVYGGPLSRRLLVAGAVGNGALVLAWAISRTVGLPLGPHPWQPEAVGAVDVLATLDELLAVVLVAGALACIRTRRPKIARPLLRLATAIAGVLFLYSVLSPFAGGHQH